MIANSSEDKYGWADINCRKALSKRTFNLEDESPHFPVMTGEHCIKAGTTFIADMRPLTGIVVLRSVRCSFWEPQLKEEHLTDVKAYLTNVNASCGIWPEETGPSGLTRMTSADSSIRKSFSIRSMKTSAMKECTPKSFLLRILTSIRKKA